MTANVGGEGIIREIVEKIIDSMTPVTKSYNIDPTPCLPFPSPLNTDRYAQIGMKVSRICSVTCSSGSKQEYGNERRNLQQ